VTSNQTMEVAASAVARKLVGDWLISVVGAPSLSAYEKFKCDDLVAAIERAFTSHQFSVHLPEGQAVAPQQNEGEVRQAADAAATATNPDFSHFRQGEPASPEGAAKGGPQQ
jgi:hypothetical protein